MANNGPRYSHKPGRGVDPDRAPAVGYRLLLLCIHLHYTLKFFFGRVGLFLHETLSRFTPATSSRALIKRDISGLSKVPSHIAVVLQPSRGIDRLVDEVADLAAWCLCCSIPILTVYEAAGELKGLDSSVLIAVKRRIRRYFRDNKRVRIATPGWDHVSGNFDEQRHQFPDIEINILSREDGKEAVLELTKTLCSIAVPDAPLKLVTNGVSPNQSPKLRTGSFASVASPIQRHGVSGSVKEALSTPTSPILGQASSPSLAPTSPVPKMSTGALRRSIHRRMARSPSFGGGRAQSPDMSGMRQRSVANGKLQPTSPLINVSSSIDDDDDDDGPGFSHEIHDGLHERPPGSSLDGAPAFGSVDYSTALPNRAQAAEQEDEEDAAVTAADVTVAFVDEHLSHMTIGEPDLLIVFRPKSRGLDDFPAWSARLCEITWRGGRSGRVTYAGFLAGLQRYGRAEMRWGK